MLRALILLALSCLLSPAFADERAQTQQQLEATRQDIAELKKMLGKLREESPACKRPQVHRDRNRRPKSRWRLCNKN